MRLVGVPHARLLLPVAQEVLSFSRISFSPGGRGADTLLEYADAERATDGAGSGVTDS